MSEPLVRKPLLRRRPSGKFVKHQFQIEDLDYLSSLDQSANWSEMGCISGITTVSINRARKGFSTNIEWAFKAFNGMNNHIKSNWDPSIPTYTQSFVDGRIKLRKVLAIVDSGIKETITISTVFGRRLRLTADHLIMTDDGWIEAQNMLGRDCFVVGGRHLPTIGIPAIVNETNISLGNGRFIDKDGYVRILAHGHPRANRSNHVYEHILVVESEYGIIPENYEIHHKDGVKSNNDISNLELISAEDHRVFEAKKSGFGTLGVYKERIVKIEINGPEHVYDLVMEAPHHNFAANDIIVHNSFKTSTVEWLMEYKLKHIPNPRILIITNKTGKGTYFESMPEVLPGWDMFNISTTRFSPIIGGRVVPVDVKLPNPLYMRPVVALAHYHCFTNRSCMPKQLKVIQEVAGREIEVPKLDPETGLFEMVIPKCAELLVRHWDLIVCDEAHRMKNHDAQWTKNIKKIPAQFRHIMTGTGIVNNPADLWSLLNFLYPKTYTSYWKFREKYCEEDDYSGYRKVVGIMPGMEDELRDLTKRIGVRRTMLECFPNIEEPIETVVPVTLNPTQQKMYNEIKEELATMDQNGTPLHSPNVLSALNRLRQICVATPEVTGEVYDAIKERRVISVTLREPSSKLDAVMEIIEGLQWDNEDKQQIVVFSAFRDPLTLLKTRLAKKNVPYLHLRSEMNDQARYEMWHDTWPRKEHQVFLATLGVGSESINLTSAHRAIFLDQSWSPVQNKQAIGRVYRPGQTEAVQLIYIRAENTVDFRILDANNEKHGWFQSIFGTGEEDD